MCMTSLLLNIAKCTISNYCYIIKVIIMPGGRPTKYKPEYAEMAYKICLLGADDKRLAGIFGVTVSTIALWKKEHEKFSDALKEGKARADAEVASSLYHRARGYSCPEDKVLSKDGVHTETVRIIKHYPPDPTAAIFWLKNRQAEHWRDIKQIAGKVDHEHNHTGTVTISQVDDFLAKATGSETEDSDTAPPRTH